MGQPKFIIPIQTGLGAELGMKAKSWLPSLCFYHSIVQTPPNCHKTVQSSSQQRPAPPGSCEPAKRGIAREGTHNSFSEGFFSPFLSSPLWWFVKCWEGTAQWRENVPRRPGCSMALPNQHPVSQHGTHMGTLLAGVPSPLDAQQGQSTELCQLSLHSLQHKCRCKVSESRIFFFCTI